jgi:K+-sensing histidine kinase KdpD
MLEEAQALGAGLASRGDPRLRSVLHDVRGGALTALMMEAAASSRPVPPPAQIALLAQLARDQAKMMRQAVVDLDPEGRVFDEREKLHHAGPIADKWSGRSHRVEGSQASIEVVCRYRDGLASRCLEAAAVDRVLYNLINNATRFAADERVTLDIFSVGRDVRFVVGNAIAADHASWLRQETQGDLAKLFEGGITRGGHGIGLTNCTLLVGAAYGQDDPAETLAQGYLGAEMRGERFLAWFHWPALRA